MAGRCYVGVAGLCDWDCFSFCCFVSGFLWGAEIVCLGHCWVGG